MHTIVCAKCGEDAKLSNNSLSWIHQDTNDTWCNPMQSQFSRVYDVTKPVFKKIER